MLRFSGCALIVLYGFGATASAEKISLRPSSGLETTVDWSDFSLQQSVISAAPTDWHDTPGADVWWVTLDGQRVHVQVFPTLERPGDAEPSCCLHFVLGDTEFWLKVKGVSSARHPAEAAADPNTSQPPGKNPHAPVTQLESLTPVIIWPEGSAWEPIPVDEGTLSHLVPPTDPLNSSDSSGDGSSESERLESEGTLTQSEFVVAQVPEPGLLALMGLGATAALRRVRTR